MDKIKLLKPLSENVTVLSLQCLKLTEAAFIKLISQFKSLKKLSMIMVEIADGCETMDPIAELSRRSLDTLFLMNRLSDNLKLFRHTTTLQSERIFITFVRDDNMINLRLVGNFLAKQQNLISLGIKIRNEAQRKILFNNLVTSMKCNTNIQHFSLHLSEQEYLYVVGPIVKMKGVIKFLEMNKNSLKLKIT